MAEARFYECSDLLDTLPSEYEIIRQGEWNGLSAEFRLKTRNWMEDQIYDLMDIFRKEMAEV